MERVGIRTLKAKLSFYLGRALAGERIVVTQRGVDVAELVPIGAEQALVHKWTASGKVRWAGGPKPAGIAWAQTRPDQPLADAIIEDRR